MRNHPQPPRRPSPQLIAEGVVATYIHEISARNHRRGADVEPRLRLSKRSRTVTRRARRTARPRAIEALGVQLPLETGRAAAHYLGMLTTAEAP